MKKQSIILAIMLILLVVDLIGCFSSPDDELRGSWFSDNGEIDDSLTFYDNGSVFHKYITVLDEEWLNYTVNQNEVTIGNIVYKFSFTDDCLKLMLTNVSENITRTYERQ